MPVLGGTTLKLQEGRLAPAQEGVAFAVAFEFDFGVFGERVGGAVMIDHHRVVDDHLGRRKRVHALGIAAEFADRFAHRRQIDHAGYAGEVLHDHARRRERDFVFGGGLRVPVEQRFDVFAGDVHAVFEAQQILEQDLQRIG